jgi:hypothetical protein
MPPAEPPLERDASTPRKATLVEVVGAVFWSFFGIRKGEAMRRDAITIRPHQVIIIGIAMAALLVAGLLVLVRLIVGSA